MTYNALCIIGSVTERDGLCNGCCSLLTPDRKNVGAHHSTVGATFIKVAQGPGNFHEPGTALW